MPRLIAHHSRIANHADPGGGLNRPACACPVADAAALYCAQLGCGGILTAGWHPHSRGTLLGAMLVCFGVPNAVWRQCDVRATAKASDGMLLSGVPIPGCRSPRPLGPAVAFHEIGLGLLPTVAGGGAAQPTSVAALGGL